MIKLIAIDPAAHAALLFQWRHQPDVARYGYSQEEIPLETHVRWLASLAGDTSRSHWIVTLADRPVGSACFTEIDRGNQRTMFGMYIADEGARLMGAGAAVEFLLLDEAFGPLALQKVSCEVFAVNTAPLRMHSRMGFRTEGILRRHARCDGQWVDVHRLSILREEWAAARPPLARALAKLTAPQSAPTLQLQSL